MHAHVLDSEHDLKMIEDEKFRVERDCKEQVEILQKKYENLEDDLKQVNTRLAEKHEQLKATDTELIVTKQKSEEKSKEIIRLKGEIARLDDELKKTQSDKRGLMTDLDTSESRNKDARAEIEAMTELNEKLSASNKTGLEREQDLSEEIKKLDLKIADLTGKNEAFKKTIESKDKELDTLTEARRANQREIDSLRNKCRETEDLLAESTQREKDMEAQIGELSSHLTNANSTLDSKEELIILLNKKIHDGEEKLGESEADVQRLRKETDVMHGLLEKYKSDIEFQRKLREEQTLKKYELEQQKKKLELDALTREREAEAAKKELNKAQDSKDRLLDERLQLSQELEALKEHAELLESQNNSVLFRVANQPL